MDDQATIMAVLLTTPHRRTLAELGLVLEAKSIPAVTEQVGRSWVLRVPAAELERAQAEIAGYLRENADAPHAPPESFGRGWPGVLAYLAVIVAMLVPTTQLSFGQDWVDAGRMDVARLRDGELWRAVTALTLHADAAHLLGNAAFGSFFGYSLARVLGGGYAWLMIVLAGVGGNLLNSVVAGADHRSLGASTAVFGALGLLTAFSWRRGYPPGAGRRERIAPIVAGIGLLAFTGAGGVNTDLGAHLFGFVCGFGLGLATARFGPPRALRPQAFAAMAAAILVAGGWAWALLA